MAGNPPTDELRKRQGVFAHPPRTILIKVLAMGPLPGLFRKERDEAAIDNRHRKQAEARGLNPEAYRQKPDTGFKLFDHEPGVRINGFIEAIEVLGFRCTAAFWQQTPKGPINVLSFTLQGEAVFLPEGVREVLERRFSHCTVWCNLHPLPRGRIDTINLAKGKDSRESSRRLVLAESLHTYRLVAE
jgi:hypothetical protein